jgi:hypothetical protein
MQLFHGLRTQEHPRKNPSRDHQRNTNMSEFSLKANTTALVIIDLQYGLIPLQVAPHAPSTK